MSPLRQVLADYLAVRRALGYKLKRKCSPRPVWCRGAGWAETMGGCGIGGRRYASSRARGTVTAPG